MRQTVLIFLALSLLPLAPQAVRADDTIRIGIVSATFGYAPVYVAKEKGFFKREGLYPEIVIISRNEQIVQALISDSLMLGLDPVRNRSKMDEALGVIVRLLAGEVVTHHADWFTLQDAQLQLLPVNASMPIAVAKGSRTINHQRDEVRKLSTATLPLSNGIVIVASSTTADRAELTQLIESIDLNRAEALVRGKKKA